MGERNEEKIPIYAAEAAISGLAEKIQSSGYIKYYTPVEDTALSQAALKKFYNTVASKDSDADVAEEQSDLYYINTILVTVGKNLNDDVFDGVETFAARNSPVNKQFNLEHDQSKIIGHMTSAAAVDENYNIIDDDIDPSTLPAKFHILTGAVIYRALSDEKAQEGIEKIIAEIENNEWYVSMECLFYGFDYAITRADGSQGILVRDEDSAYLTKHLRCYGGTGKYNDVSVARLLRHITFSGKGLVRKPANPESIIFNKDIASFNSTLGYLDLSNVNEPMEIDMANEKTVSDEVLAAKDDEIKKLREELTEAKTSNNAAKIAGLENSVTAKDGEIASLQSQVAEATSKVTKLETDLAAATQKAEAFEKDLKAIKASEVVRARVEALTKKNAPEAEAKELVAKFSDLSDDQFNAMVELVASKWVVPAAPVTEETVVVPASVEVELDPKASATLTIANTSDKVEETRKSLETSFASVLTQNRTRKVK